MVDLKFYVVSIVAVFLALALGILLGSVIVGQQGQQIPEKLIKSIEADVEKVRLENQFLSQENQEMNKFFKEVYPYLIKNRLLNVKVGLVYFDEGTRETAREVKDFLEKASAKTGLVEFNLHAFNMADLTQTSRILGLDPLVETSFSATVSTIFFKLTTSTVDLPATLGKLDFLKIIDFGLKDLPFDYLVVFLPANQEELNRLAKVNFNSQKTIMGLNRTLLDASKITLPTFDSTLVYGVDTLTGQVSLVFAFGSSGARLGYRRDRYFLDGKLE